MSNRKKLPPLAQPGDGTPEGETLAQIKLALTKPVGYMSEEEYRAMQRRSSLCLPIFEEAKHAKVLMRRGKLVWRITGEAGADLDRPPLGVVIARLRQRFEADLEKIGRCGRLLLDNRDRKGVRARQQNAQALRDEVLRLAKEYTDKGRKPRELASLIAKKLKITPRHVRRILQENKRT